MDRRAVQLGLRGETLLKFATDWIVSIEDITPFVHEQKEILDRKGMNEIYVIKEEVIPINDGEIRRKLQLD